MVASPPDVESTSRLGLLRRSPSFGLLFLATAGSSFGTYLAAIVLTVVEDLLSSQTERWLMAIGLLYVVVALLPSGRDAIAAGGGQHGVVVRSQVLGQEVDDARFVIDHEHG